MVDVNVKAVSYNWVMELLKWFLHIRELISDSGPQQYWECWSRQMNICMKNGLPLIYVCVLIWRERKDIKRRESESFWQLKTAARDFSKNCVWFWESECVCSVKITICSCVLNHVSYSALYLQYQHYFVVFLSF